MSTPLVTIVDEAKALLASIPHFDGEKNLAEHGAPPRYVWIVTGASSSGTRSAGGNPRTFHDDAWGLVVHCWGETLDQALRLRQALVTALRRAVRGANYRLGQTLVNADNAHVHLGAVVTVQIDLVTPLAEANLATLADLVRPTVRPTEVELDTTGQVTGDRNLDAPNEPPNQ